jgi:hypothetical protein
VSGVPSMPAWFAADESDFVFTSNFDGCLSVMWDLDDPFSVLKFFFTLFDAV